MCRWLVMALIVVAPCVLAGTNGEMTRETQVPCSEAWYRYMEEKVPTGDGQGHGPDIGSEEWKSVIEFRLGIRGNPELPARGTEAWCRAIDAIVRGSGGAPSEDDGKTAMSPGPSYDCGKAGAGSIEALICADGGLSKLDRTLADVYKAASRKAADEHPPVLKAEQRGWIKGRNDCWKNDDQRKCVEEAYRERIAELQARYHLVPGIGPVTYLCDGPPGNEVVATFFQTDPPTLIAEHGDSVSLMYLQPSGSGTRYQGRNETLWEHQGEATITWGYNTPATHCRKAP